MTEDRILVTGATGFVGRHLVTHLLREKKKLLLVLRNTSACPAEWLQHTQIEIAEIPDLTTAPLLFRLASQAHTIIHIAGLAHVAPQDRSHDADRFMQANARLTAALTDAALEAGIKTFIHMSSLASITGNATSEIIDDRTNHEPVTAYGRSKRAAESQVRRLREAGIFAVSLRPPLIIGAKAKGNWASLQALAASGIPLPFAAIDNRRSFVSIETLTEAISTLCNGHWSPSLSDEYCIADPGPISLPEIIRTLRGGMGKPARQFSCPATVFRLLGAATRRQPQMAALTGNLVVDATRFLKTFGFTPTLPLDRAIHRSGLEYLSSIG